MPSPRTASLTFAVVLWSLSATATASTCSAAEDQRVYQLYQAVAADPLCSPYVTGGIAVQWSCDKTPSCTQLQQQLALQLPDCQSSSDGTNYRSQLNNALYEQCKLCTLDQLQAFSALTKQVAQSAACSPYSDGSAGFSWPCTATGCTAVVKGVAKDVPSCNYAGDNLQARVLNDIEACTGTSVATTRPPSGGASGDDPSSPSSTTSPSTATPSPSSVSAGDEQEDTTSSPSTTPARTTETLLACTAAETATVRRLLGTAANSSNCAGVGTFVYTTSISIASNCESPCLNQSVRPLAASLPDCFVAPRFSSETVRREVQQEIGRCDANTKDTLSILITFAASSNADDSSSTAPPRSISASAAAPLSSPAWVRTGVALLLAIALAFPQLLRD